MIKSIYVGLSVGFVVHTIDSIYWTNREDRIRDINYAKEQAKHNYEQAKYFKDHEYTSVNYKNEAELYEEFVVEQEVNLKSFFRTIFSPHTYIPDIEKEAYLKTSEQFKD